PRRRPPATYRISRNRFRSDNPHEVAFVRNQTVAPAVLEGNQLEGAVVALVGPGTVDEKPAGEALAGARSQERPAPADDEESAAGPVADLEPKLRLLKRLFEEDLITQEEYTGKKAQLLRSF
ncbi:MAG TPA: SHOCT domain-containing protein, partial [Geminicoccaceae bacterium]|nr:SHOCT domain-containing protein [Geminicoccaceae bacterium]